MNIAIIFAGGIGQRFGNEGLPKQFVEVLEKPLVIHTLEVFEIHPEIDKIYISTVKEYREYTEKIIKDFGISKVAGVTDGGETSQDSIYNALKQAKKENPDDSIVLIHDGVRPIIYPDVISKNINSVKQNGNAITCTPCCETIIVSEDGLSPKEVLLRNDAYTAQAPQSFRLGDIIEAHEAIRNRPERYRNIIDSCTMYHYLKRRTYIVRGNLGNVKITTPWDIHALKEAIKFKKKKQ
ncbi:MAG: 2-C-methyl-D-erythritol 4-phosphate cytidylyltransferase [Holosporales bacterium]|jgi:2-C-methyl-D-erythritol 4-phosphate cytidylyltransferase|nr:2-C-methyl-D-erythritol 4-phosphate cytidylyltransferase [Holosporales bacterium]